MRGLGGGVLAFLYERANGIRSGVCASSGACSALFCGVRGVGADDLAGLRVPSHTQIQSAPAKPLIDLAYLVDHVFKDGCRFPSSHPKVADAFYIVLTDCERQPVIFMRRTSASLPRCAPRPPCP